MVLEPFDRVVRERLIGSPPHSLQHLGTMEKLNYVGTIGKIAKLGTIATIGTVLLAVYSGTVGKVNRVGTQKWLGTVDRVAYASRLGTLAYGNRIGTVGHLGSIPYLGSVNRLGGGRVGSLGRLGTVHYVERIGTLQKIGTVTHVQALGSIRGRTFTKVTEWNNLHIARASSYVGSWRRVDQYRTKTIGLRPTFPGTLHILASVGGTGIDLGTYFSGRIGAGTHTVLSLEDAIYQMKLRFLASGSSGSGKGSLTGVIGHQV